MILRIGHNAYRTENMEKALHFYCDILGFRKIFSLKKDDGSPWIEYVRINDTQFIELFHDATRKVEIDPDTIGYAHLCLEVDSIDDIVKEMNEKNIPIVSGPKQGKDLNWQAWVVDPDGNRIEFMQLDPESPQAKNK